VVQIKPWKECSSEGKVRDFMAFDVLVVHTESIEVFSDLFKEVEKLTLTEGQETEVEGVKVSGGGQVDEEYVNEMRIKPEVAVLKVRNKNITILQHGGLFEVLIPA
jgi:hypothetical protein